MCDVTHKPGQKAPPIEIDHIGIAVKTHGDARAFWEALGWDLNSAPKETVADQKVNVAFLNTQNQASLELLQPTDDTSTVAKFMERRGPGIHHICLRVKKIEEVLSRLKATGVRLINESPVMGADQCRVAFVHPSSTGGILVELSEKVGKS
jgi:methylmalonyl-CoA epimerase